MIFFEIKKRLCLRQREDMSNNSMAFLIRYEKYIFEYFIYLLKH